MSGRKACEVASVLKEVEKSQEEIVKNYQSTINKNLEEIDEIKGEILNDEIESKIEVIKDEKLKDEFKNYAQFFKNSENIKTEFSKIIEERNKLLKRANEIREKIKNTSHYVTKEYNEAVEINKKINNQKNKLLKLKNQSENLKHQVFKLRSFIDNVDDIFNARKQFLEDLFTDIEKKLYNEDYILLEDIVNKKNNKVSKIEYYDNYNNKNNIATLRKNLDKVDKLIDNNKFEVAEKELNKLNNKINQISNEADKIKENIESSLLLSLKIRDIMLNKAGFSRANIDIINNNPVNGFKIYTKNGDTINFEEVKIEDGKPTIDLDHIEGKAGSCGIKWKDLQKIFREEGIPLTDVTKNGYSILYGGTKTKANGETKQKGHK